MFSAIALVAGIAFTSKAVHDTYMISVEESAGLLEAPEDWKQELGASGLFRNAHYSIEKLRDLAEAEGKASEHARAYLLHLRSLVDPANR